MRARTVAILRRLALIGPHPVRLLRTLIFVFDRRWRQHRLRRNYDELVARAKPRSQLCLPRMDLPRMDQLPDALKPAARDLCSEARLVLEHRVEFLGSGVVALGKKIDWHLDFKSGYRWEPIFYQDVQVTRLDDESDAKVPWELSRGHQLLTLARAARLTGDRSFADGLECQLMGWLEDNPAGRGINWVTPMEIGFRAVNWLWALGTMEPEVPVSPTLRERVARSLYWHARHIEANLEGTPYLRSNHYLGNILGLIAIGAAFPGDRVAQRWFNRAHAAFERQILRQVYADGVGFEGSLAYHGLSLEMFLVARRVGDLAGRPFSARYDRQLMRMLDVIRAARHPNGRIPLFGDQDSGRVLPAGYARPPTHDHLLWTGAALLGSDPPLSGPPSPEVAWNLGITAYAKLSQKTDSPPRPPPTAFRHGGLYILEGGGTHVAVRCGDVGQNGAGGHAHNDLLSYELSREVPLIVDSGTYAYTFDVRARNQMRASAAHNVTLVDGEEINPIDPQQVFRLEQVANPHVDSWSEGAECILLKVRHDGYTRLRPPVSMARRFTLDRESGALDVRDEVAGTGERVVETFVHLAAGSIVRLVDERVFDVDLRGTSVRISFAPVALMVTVDENWISDRYGQRTRAPMLLGRTRAQLPIVVEYRVDPLAGAALASTSRADALAQKC